MKNFEALGMIDRLVAFLSLVVATTVLADTIAVDDFTPGTTISSSAMNSNFGTLVSESNENDARIAANEQSISALTASVNGIQYRWLGYTSNTFEASSMGIANGANLSNHCKSEFGSSASAANLEHLEAFFRNSSVALPSTNAWLLPSWDFKDENEYAVNTFFGIDNPGAELPCLINNAAAPAWSVTCGTSASNATPRLVACVAPN